MPLVHRRLGKIGRRKGQGGLAAVERARQTGRHGAPDGPPNWFLATGVLMVGSLLLHKVYQHHHVPRAPPFRKATPNDLHAVHDLLAVGAAGVFLLDADTGAASKAADAMALLLEDVHPIEECRNEIRDARSRPEHYTGQMEPSTASAANAAWRCLPAGFVSSDFEKPFEVSHVGRPGLEKRGRRALVLDKSVLGACRPSTWDRACSLWVSLHALGARADALGKSKAFLDAAYPLLAGGATQCAACTDHIRLFFPGKGVLYDKVVHELSYCANVQCSKAQQHTVPLVECVRNPRQECATRRLSRERADIQHFKRWLRSRVDGSAFDVFVVLHNLVTNAVRTKEVKRYVCADDAYAMLPAALGGGRARDRRPPLPPGISIPGIGPHRLLDCPP
jgi:hypothetical protein